MFYGCIVGRYRCKSYLGRFVKRCIMNIVLASGGVDSLTTMLMLKQRQEEFEALFVDLGHRYREAEWEAVNNLVFDLKIVLNSLTLEDIGKFEKENAEIEYRNLVLIISALWKGADKVYLSVEQGTSVNESRDRDEEFINWVVSGLGRMSGRKIEVENLVSEFTKEDEVRWIVESWNKNGRKLLDMTFSCYNPVKGKMCGKCNACIRYWLAYVGNDLKVPDGKFDFDPKKSEKFQEYLQKTKEGVYVGRRGEQYRRVFQKLGVW